MPRARIGVFGGTFDPPHLGHLRVASAVADHLSLERVLLVLAGRPPHKPQAPLTREDVRLEMLRAAAGHDSRFEVCELELRRPGPSYTVDTLGELSRQMPEAELYLIVGADQFHSLETWHTPEAILRLAHLVVMDREGLEGDDRLPDVAGAEAATFVPVPRVDVSSSAVRERVADGAPIAGLVPEAVERIIGRERLYRL